MTWRWAHFQQICIFTWTISLRKTVTGSPCFRYATLKQLFFAFTSLKSKNETTNISGPALPFQPHEGKCCSYFWPLGSMHLLLCFQNVLQGFKPGRVAVIHSLDFLWEKSEVGGVMIVNVILFNAYQLFMSCGELTVMLPAISALMGEKTAEPRQSKTR